MPAHKNIKDLLLAICLLAALLAPRLPGLADYATLDEPYWLSMGANFYYALGQREFANTVYEYQPAVTTMWIVTAAMLAYFPEYRGFGQGYPFYNKIWLDDFLLEHGKHPLELLHTARLIQVLIVALLFLVLYYLLQKFIHRYAAAFAVLFASFDPFFLSQSRILDHEALLSLLVMISLLALLAYLTQGRQSAFLVISGFAAGLAQLTKSSALAIFAPVGILFLIQIYRDRAGANPARAFFSNAKIFLLWLGLLVAAYFIFWPGMWVAPQKMLYEVYGNAFSYAFQGGRLTVTGELDSSQFSLDTNLAGIWSLALMVLRRTTPLTWLGVLLGFLLLKRSPKSEQPYSHNQEIFHTSILFALFWVTAIAFILLFGIAQGRNSPHYILCSYLALNLLAGLGWYELTRRLANRQVIRLSILIAVAVFQAWSFLPRYPYYFTYENPLLPRADDAAPLFPYGEGLELAAQYLAGLPDAQESTALVYYNRGCFSYFYPGQSSGFKNFYTDGYHNADLVAALRAADYVVVYDVVQGRLKKYGQYVAILAQNEPLHEVWLDGRKYVTIYAVSQLPESVFVELENLQPLETTPDE